jgi:hypothetical protein
MLLRTRLTSPVFFFHFYFNMSLLIVFQDSVYVCVEKKPRERVKVSSEIGSAAAK